LSLVTAQSYNWTHIPAPEACYHDMVMVSASVGYAVAEQGIVVGTKDGEKWLPLLNAPGDYYWYGVHAFDANNVIITGFVDAAAKSIGVLRSSSDGGATWSNDMIVDSKAWLTSTLQFKDPMHGLVLAALSCHAWATSDGGKTWIKVPICDGWLSERFLFDSDDGSVTVSGTSFCYAPGNTWPPVFKCKAPIDVDADGPPYPLKNGGMIVGGGDISPTITGWSHVRDGPNGKWSIRSVFPWPIRAFHFVDDHYLGIAVGGNYMSNAGGVYGTVDGGATWTKELSTKAEQHVVAAVPGSSGTVYMASCGNPGLIHRGDPVPRSPPGNGANNTKVRTVLGNNVDRTND